MLEALRRAEREWEEGRFNWQAWEADAHATRAMFGRLVGMPETSVALVGSVAEAAATVAASLPLGRIVVGAREFRSNFFPWLALRGRGFEITEVPAEDDVVSTSALVQAIQPGTVLVTVSEVQSSNGYRVRLSAVVNRAHAVGARVFVNLTQSLGVLRVSLADLHADYAAAHGYKWLLGPRGAAWLAVRPDRLGELRPLTPGWKSVEKPYDDYYGGPYDPAPDARRLDGSFAWFPWVGAHAALQVITSLSAEAVERRCLELAALVRSGARRAGFGTVPEEEPSQIVALAVADPSALRDRLQRRGVVAAVRGGYVRMGLHAFNNELDVDNALRALRG